MIDAFTAMTGVAAWLAGTSLYALNGWRKALKARDIAKDNAAHWQQEYERGRSMNGRFIKYYTEASDRAADLEDQLRTIERQRSDATRKGNLTRAAKRKALLDATTANLRDQLTQSVAQMDMAA